MPMTGTTLACPECHATDICTKDSRAVSPDKYRRRRSCNVCGHRWRTYEITHDEYQRLKSIQEKTRVLADELRNLAID